MYSIPDSIPNLPLTFLITKQNETIRTWTISLIQPNNYLPVDKARCPHSNILSLDVRQGPDTPKCLTTAIATASN